MGCGMSKKKMSPYKITHLCQMEREIKIEPRIFAQNIVEYLIDEHPVMINDSLFINLEPQKVSLEFMMTLSGDDISFELIHTTHRDRYESIFEVMSEQILVPILNVQNILIENGIVHYFRESELHLRILANQLLKIWFIEDGKLNPFTSTPNEFPWKIMVTDHNKWSTGQL
jgi:hypothetical protein